jgi:TolB-like protein/Tfp pilus assembly protein PilF
MDIVAYSQLPMDEQTRLIEKLQQIVRNTTEFSRAQKRRQLLRLPTGDGMALVFFGDAEAAVRCALEISRAVRELPDLKLRMGIHTGPVQRVEDINANRNVAGGGINIAQRVMDCGDAGHILISKTVADVLDQVSTWKTALHDLGEAEVKHGVRVHLYNLYTDEAGNRELPQKLRTAQTTAAKTEAGRQNHSRRRLWGAVAGVAAFLFIGGAFLMWRFLHSRTSDATPIHSIAVLPFANASKDPEMDYLGEGIAEEITNSLSRLPNLQVMAHSTVFHYRSRQDDPQGVGHDMHVDAVLTGRVVKHGNELSVETEVVDVLNGAQFWGKRYTRSANDASLLQADITHDLASQLRPQLAGVQQERLSKVGTKDAEAYQFYLKGRYRFQKWTGEDFKAAAEFFSKAIARDPNYADAYAGLADVSVQQGYDRYVSGRETYDKSRTAAMRALELDSQSPEPHLSLALGDILYFWNFAEAETEIQRALALDPNSAYAHEMSCWFDLQMGKMQESITECRKAVELDPLSSLYNSMLGDMYYENHDYAQAIEQENKTLEMDPKNFQAMAVLGLAYGQMGNYKKAMEQWIRAEQVDGNGTRAKELMQIFQKSGYPGFLMKDAKDDEADGNYYDAAADRAMLGQKDAAFALLEKAFANRTGLIVIKTTPELDSIRSDPRYADLLRRMGLPQ